MNLSSALRDYNRWRRGDDTAPMPEPKALGVLIEQAAAELERLSIIETAARTLCDQKGRFNTQTAYERLAETLGKKL